MKKSLAQCSAPIFSALLAASPQEQLIEKLNGFKSRAVANGATPEKIEAVMYGLVALIDEKLFSITDNNAWQQQPLQLKYFNSHDAGVEFFHKLHAFRYDPNWLDVLEIYYTCLALGFTGHYRQDSRALKQLQCEMKQQLFALWPQNTEGCEVLSVSNSEHDKNNKKFRLECVIYLVIFVMLIIVVQVALRMNMSMIAVS